MAQTPTLPPFAAIVVAAGKGLRAGGDLPKQFREWRGMPVLRHSVKRLHDAGADPILVVVGADAQSLAAEALKGMARIAFVEGGETRQQSVSNGLEAVAGDFPTRIVVHDAARPDLPFEVLERLLHALENHAGAIPTLPVVDSLVVSDNAHIMRGTAERESIRRVQTPQAFQFDEILAAHRSWQGPKNAGDDAQVLAAHEGEITLVEGDERLKKLTFEGDFMPSQTTPFRIGQGYDVHRLAEDEELWLCGVKIAHDKGLAGHSDADVALHAITDAVLGAIGAGDIGTHFPPSDPKWKGARSSQFLEHAVGLAKEASFSIGNIDLTIICEAPKIGPHRDAMRAAIAVMAGLEESAVSVKATTTEKLGFTGRGEGIAAQAIVSLFHQENS
ncbi:MAG: bifunctional 2-C-methyl-D-erythritol 4-phosphate cytidylyltransferase/2-C-methyl-D-erythritol 2,4-cyclodiphosphate synthase [Erythrobacter sp.]